MYSAWELVSIFLMENIEIHCRVNGVDVLACGGKGAYVDIGEFLTKPEKECCKTCWIYVQARNAFQSRHPEPKRFQARLP